MAVDVGNAEDNHGMDKFEDKEDGLRNVGVLCTSMIVLAYQVVLRAAEPSVEAAS